MLYLTSLLFTVAFQPPGFFNNTRTYVPHITKDDTRFRTALVLENPTADEQFVLVRAVAANGAALGEYEWTLPAGAREKKWRDDLFGDTTIDYMVLNKVSEVVAGVIYEPIAQPQNALRIGDTSETATHWRVYPSNWNDNFDGLILLNTLCLNLNAVVTYHQADGTQIGEQQRYALAPGHKALLNLGEAFTFEADAYIQVRADRRVMAMAVKGSKAADAATSFLVGNLAKAMDSYPDLRAELAEARQKWAAVSRENGYTFQQAFRCFCPQEVTQITQIGVNGAVIDSLSYVESGEQVPVSAVKRYYSVEEMFALIEQELGRADYMEVDFDAETGFPTFIGIDPSDCVADEEYSIVSQGLANR